MSFGDRLKSMRKKRGLTQEQLAERLGVSRQAISKWESNSGYPESDKLLIIANELDTSLDFLMGNNATEQEQPNDNSTPISENRIFVTKFDGSQIVNCLSVRYQKILSPAKHEPAYILEGIDKLGLFGEHSIILGWYEDEESAKRELDEIIIAMNNHEKVYKLKYFTDVKISIWGTTSIK